MKKITIGIPAFKAEKHICDALASIQIQTIKEEVKIIIAKDNPDDDYEFVKKRYPELDITILECEKNTGPGLARQRALDAADTDWITFMDADDVLIGPFALESLLKGATANPYIIECQGTFYQEVNDKNTDIRMSPRNDVGHPWVFGRLYKVPFLKENDIAFSELRAMEDGEFNWKIRMSIEGSQLQINIIDAPIYLWRTGSEHSITRIGADDKDGIPQYNFDLCQWGATEAAIRATKFCRSKNPFNGGINRFIAETMVGQYYTYIECLEKKPVFAEQNLFNAKKFYHECYKEIESTISDKILKDIYTIQRAQKSQDIIGIIPQISFFEFMERVKTEEYRGDDEFKEIRSRLPKKVIENDLKTGVLGK